jgi:hypothetical protein
MKYEKKKKSLKKQVSSSKPYKPELNSHIRNPLKF